MRLVVLTAAYPSAAEPERAVYVENQCRELAGNRGPGQPIDVCVVAPRAHASDPLEESRGGIPVRRFPYPSGGRRLKEWPRPSVFALGAYALSGLQVLVDALRAGPADALLCHWVLPTGPIAAAAAAVTGVPYGVVAHGSDILRYARSSAFLGMAARGALRPARRVLAVSDALRLALERDFGLGEQAVSVIPMGIDGALFRPGPTELPREATPRLLFVGDVIAEKGIPELLEAVETLERRGLSVELRIAGEGRLRPAEVDAGGRRRVQFLGRVSQARLADLYRTSTLLVLPSHSEGTPVTVMEALACGLPVVASRIGGIPDLVEEGLTGWLTSPRDAAALAVALEGILRSGDALDRARRALRETPRDFSASRRAGEMRPVLEELARGA